MQWAGASLQKRVTNLVHVHEETLLDLEIGCTVQVSSLIYMNRVSSVEVR